MIQRRIRRNLCHMTICAICLKLIIDRSDVSDGEDSVFCEGACQRWLHRSCAGLPDPAFDLIHNSDEKFYCFPCSMASHALDVKELRSVVASLSKDLADLRSSIASPVVNNQLRYADVVSSSNVNTGSSSASPAPPLVPASSALPHSSVPPPRSTASGVLHPLAPPPRSASTADERKYNIVVFGVDECPKGTPRVERGSRDEAAIVQSIQVQIPSFNPLSIRDCFRLGKYVESSSRPRPILVSLNRVADVNSVLSKRSSLSSDGFRVKPDLPPEERHAESLLLKERWLLIDEGTDRGLIKMQRSCLYVSGRLHCRVNQGTLFRSNSLADHAPQLVKLSGNSSQESQDDDDSSPISSYHHVDTAIVDSTPQPIPVSENTPPDSHQSHQSQVKPPLPNPLPASSRHTNDA